MRSKHRPVEAFTDLIPWAEVGDGGTSAVAVATSEAWSITTSQEDDSCVVTYRATVVGRLSALGVVTANLAVGAHEFDAVIEPSKVMAHTFDCLRYRCYHETSGPCDRCGRAAVQSIYRRGDLLGLCPDHLHEMHTYRNRYDGAVIIPVPEMVIPRRAPAEQPDTGGGQTRLIGGPLHGDVVAVDPEMGDTIRLPVKVGVRLDSDIDVCVYRTVRYKIHPGVVVTAMRYQGDDHTYWGDASFSAAADRVVAEYKVCYPPGDPRSLGWAWTLPHHWRGVSVIGGVMARPSRPDSGVLFPRLVRRSAAPGMRVSRKAPLRRR